MVDNAKSMFITGNCKKAILKMVEFLKCPKCESFAIWKYGSYVTIKGKRQKYKCVICGHVWRKI